MSDAERLERLAALHLVGGVVAMIFGSDLLLAWCYGALVCLVWRWGQLEVGDED